jgi:hypothetical protein
MTARRAMITQTHLILLSVLLLWATTGTAQPLPGPLAHATTVVNPPRGNPPSRFMRIIDGGDSIVSTLELAIVRYGTPDCRTACPEVDLIAVIHIADAAFYETINQLLPTYDVVLYEYIAADSTANPAAIPHEQGGDWHRMHRVLAGVLGFQQQIACIDYTGANMLHADMNRSEFLGLLEESGEGVPDFGALAGKLENSLPPGLRDPDNIDLESRCRFRRMAAAKLLKPGKSNGLFASLWVVPRNDRVIEILREQLLAGRRKIAILYGAGHMPDLQEKLLSVFDMQPLKRRWLAAWDLCNIATR